MNEVENRNLPDGWQLRPIGELVQPTRPRISPKEKPELPFLGMDHIEAHTMRQLGSVPADSMKSSAVHFQPGDVMYGRLRPYLNKVYQPHFEGLCSAEFIVFPESSELNNKYLQYFLNSSIFVRHATSLNSGDRPRVKFEQFESYEIPIPPTLEQQKRIVAKIEKLFSHIDAGITSLQAAKKLLKQYRQSVLKAAVTGELTKDWRETNKDKLEPASQLLKRILKERRQRWEEQQLEQFKAKGKLPKDDKWKEKYKEPSFQSSKDESELPNGWCWASICQVANVVSGQTTKGIAESLGTGEIPWFKIGDMNTHGNEKYMLISKSMLTREEAVKCKVNIQPENTIIFPKRGGAIATNKKRILAMPSAYDLNTMGMSPILIDLGFLWTWFLCIDLASISNGSNVPQINHKDIEPLDIPLPPLDEQYEISRTTQEKLEAIERLDTEISHDVKKADKNKQSILASAFLGNLN